MAIVVVGAKENGAAKPAEIVKKVDAPASGGGNGNGNGLVILTEVRRSQPNVPGIADDMAMGFRQALGEGEIYIASDPIMEFGVGYAEKAASLVKGVITTAGNTVKGGTAVLKVGVETVIENNATDAQRLGFREGGLAGLVGATIVQEGVKGLVGMVRRRREKKQQK